MPSKWLPPHVANDVADVAQVFYVNRKMTKAWNKVRGENELRLLTGWAWVAKHNNLQRQGFKTQTVCIRDAWYTLVKKNVVPDLARTKRPAAPRRPVRPVVMEEVAA